jgi:hypothetical protein
VAGDAALVHRAHLVVFLVVVMYIETALSHANLTLDAAFRVSLNSETSW